MFSPHPLGGFLVEFAFCLLAASGRHIYAELLVILQLAGRGFIALGLEPTYTVAILGFNSPEWFMADIGAIFAGGFAAGICECLTPHLLQLYLVAK